MVLIFSNAVTGYHNAKLQTFSLWDEHKQLGTGICIEWDEMHQDMSR